MADSANQTRFLNPWKLHLQKLGLELKCPLCLILFKNPVLVPCNHIFCKSCIPTNSQFGYECLVCKAPYSSRDLRAAPYMENMVTIYKSMEATLNASLNYSNPDAGRVSEKQLPSITVETFRGEMSSCRPCVSSLPPKIEDGISENENFVPRNIGGKETGNCKLPPLSSNLRTGRNEECETPNINQVSQSSFGSPPSFGDTKGLDDDSSDRGSEQSPQKYSSKRPAEINLNRAGQEKNDSLAPGVEEHHVRVLKRQKKLSYGSLETSGKNDVRYQAVSSKFVESTVPGPTPESKCGGTHSSSCALQPSIPNSSHEAKTVCAFCQSSNLSQATGPMLHYANGKPVAGEDACHPNVIHVHTQCIEWAPQVYYSGETVKNLEREVARGAKLKCSSCGLKGAALGCYEKKCRKTYHVPCASKVLDCRWDCDNYLLLCPSHLSIRFPNEKSAPVKRDFNKHPLPAPMSKTLEQSKFWEASLHGEQEWVLCGSALSAEEKFLLVKFAGMSGITVSKLWKPNVTHVIAATDANGACCRTVKVLMAILHGKWILTIDWIKACMNAKHPVDEEPYEVSMDNHGCCDGPKTGRLRLLANEPKLLNGFHFYFSGGFLLEYMRDLKSLVIAAGGTVLNNRAEVFIQSHDDSSTILVVYNLDTSQGCKLGEEYTAVLQQLKEAQELAELIGSGVIGHTWLLESIAACKLQPLAG